MRLSDRIKRLEEAQVEVGGMDKRAGAQVLAMILVKYLVDDGILEAGNRRAQRKVQRRMMDIIIDSTF